MKILQQHSTKLKKKQYFSKSHFCLQWVFPAWTSWTRQQENKARDNPNIPRHHVSLCWHSTCRYNGKGACYVAAWNNTGVKSLGWSGTSNLLHRGRVLSLCKLAVLSVRSLSICSIIMYFELRALGSFSSLLQHTCANKIREHFSVYIVMTVISPNVKHLCTAELATPDCGLQCLHNVFQPCVL